MNEWVNCHLSSKLNGEIVRYSVICALSILLTAGFNSANALPTDTPPNRDDDWALGSLLEAGFDIGKMDTLTRKLISGGHKNAHEVLIEYDGKLVYEQYLEGEDQNWGNSIGNVKFDCK